MSDDDTKNEINLDSPTTEELKELKKSKSYDYGVIVMVILIIILILAVVILNFISQLNLGMDSDDLKRARKYFIISLFMSPILIIIGIGLIGLVLVNSNYLQKRIKQYTKFNKTYTDSDDNNETDSETDNEIDDRLNKENQKNYIVGIIIATILLGFNIVTISVLNFMAIRRIPSTTGYSSDMVNKINNAFRLALIAVALLIITGFIWVALFIIIIINFRKKKKNGIYKLENDIKTEEEKKTKVKTE